MILALDNQSVSAKKVHTSTELSETHPPRLMHREGDQLKLVNETTNGIFVADEIIWFTARAVAAFNVGKQHEPQRSSSISSDARLIEH